MMFDALTIAGIGAAIAPIAFIVTTCLRKGCSRRCAPANRD